MFRYFYSYATHLLDDEYDIRTVQEPAGHKDARTAMVYTHVLNRSGRGVRGPIDSLCEKTPLTAHYLDNWQSEILARKTSWLIS